MARAGNEKMRLHYFGNLDTDRMVANRDVYKRQTLKRANPSEAENFGNSNPVQLRS